MNRSRYPTRARLSPNFSPMRRACARPPIKAKQRWKRHSSSNYNCRRMTTCPSPRKSDLSTVVAEFQPDAPSVREATYQSEAALEKAFIQQLQLQAYDYLPITSEVELLANLRRQMERLNKITFSDAEWERFFTTSIAGANDGIREKTARIQEDHIQVLKRDDGTTKNVYLIDKASIHNNALQVINQYETPVGENAGARATRFDVTVLVNGLPMVHVELKRRGV